MDDEFPFPLYERVTTVLSPFSGMDKIDPQILAAACDRGTAVHEVIECLQEGLPTGDISPALHGYIDSYETWAKGKHFIARPDRFYDDEYMITGECDCIYDLNGDLILVDFKTSANEGKTWKYQGAAYAHMARKKGYDIKAIEFVKLSKEGKFARSYIYDEAAFDGFLRLLKTYREFFQNNKQAFDLGDF